MPAGWLAASVDADHRRRHRRTARSESPVSAAPPESNDASAQAAISLSRTCGRSVAVSHTIGELGIPNQSATRRDGPPIELIVSVQTQLLDSQPRLSSLCHLFGQSIDRLIGAEHTICSIDTQSILPRDGADCILMPLSADGATYAEIVHPSDFTESKLASSADPAAARVDKLDASNINCLARTWKRASYCELACWDVRRSPGRCPQCRSDYAEFAASDPPLTV